MASLASAMKVLRAFSAERPELSVSDLAEITGMPASTNYRIVRDLLREGLLVRWREGYYRIGTAVLAYERLLRLADPVVRIGQQTITELVGKVDVPCRGLVSCLYGDRVMCVADAAANTPSFVSSYERGRPMPLLQGATSKAVLAMLPPRTLKKLMAVIDARAQEALSAELRDIRRSGVRVSNEEVDEGVAGIAVPFRIGPPRVLGSLSLVIASDDISPATEMSLAKLLMSSRDTFETLINRAATGLRES